MTNFRQSSPFIAPCEPTCSCRGKHVDAIECCLPAIDDIIDGAFQQPGNRRWAHRLAQYVGYPDATPPIPNPQPQ